MSVETTLSKEDLSGRNAVRNSSYRELTGFTVPYITAFQESHPNIRAWHLSVFGLLASMVGVGIAEYQNISGNHNKILKATAVVACAVGEGMDIGDGIFARIYRSKMTDEKAKVRSETIGQALDPLIDGLKEAFQCGITGVAAVLRGDLFGAGASFAKIPTENLPRTAKAIVGSFGIKVPENYSFKSLLHGDIRPLGTSLGRRIPNYLSTLFPKYRGIPVQEIVTPVATVANLVVTAERIEAKINLNEEKTLNEKEIWHSKIRAVALGAETLLLFGGAYYLAKRFLFKGK